jgi:photosystem II stability/assembly factor-like uncharacterized protein
MAKPHAKTANATSTPPLRAGVLVAILAVVLVVVAPAASAAPEGWRAPFVLQPGSGLFAQYGYAPDHTRNVPTFDSADRPYIRSRTANGSYSTYVDTLVNGTWTELDFSAALLAAFPDYVDTVGAGGLRSDSIVFDREDRAYNPLTIRLADGKTRNVLMVSSDLCHTWKVFRLPAGDFTVEHWVGHNEIDGPPFLAFWRPAPLPYDGHRGGRFSLWVTKPYLDGERLVIPTLTHVTDDCLGLSKDSGGASFAVTHEGSTWFVWPGSTPGRAPGVPQFIARYDHLSGAVSEPLPLLSTPPANDPHNKPGICIDSQGYLHVVGGTHGTAVPYVRSAVPYSCEAGWTLPQPVLGDGYVSGGDPPLTSGRQTYDAFVCDSQDTLHLVTRQWRRGVDPQFPGQYYGALIHQSRPADGTWGAPTVIVVPPAPGYAVYYHKLALDHRDHLFLSCSYDGGAELWAERAHSADMKVLGRDQLGNGQYHRRMLLVSDDGGSAWRLAANEDLSGGAVAATAPRTPALRQARRRDALLPGLRWLSPTPQGDQLTAIDFVDGARGWAVGTLGTIMNTTDGGRTWNSQGAPTEADLFGLAAVDRTTAWAVGEGGVILRTSDGGATWQQQASGTTDGLFAVEALSARRAWVVGTRGLALVTSDSGRSWTRRAVGPRETLFSVTFTDALHGWLAGSFGYIRRTRDGGRTWRVQDSSTSACVYSVDFCDSRHGLAVGAGGLVLRTANGGRTWREARSGVTSQLSAVRMASTKAAWITGADGVVLATSDGGRTWRDGSLPVKGMAGALDLGPRGRLWAAGAAGSVCRSVDAGRSWSRLTEGFTASLSGVTSRGAKLWVAGADGLLAWSSGGAWQRIPLGSTATVDDLSFGGADGWVVGQRGLVAHSTDGGRTWVRIHAPATADLSGVAASGPGRAWVAGDRGTLMSTDDGGSSWRTSSIVANDLRCLRFLDAAHGWAGGGSLYGEGRALVLRSEDGGSTWERTETPIWGRVNALSFVDAEHGWAAAEDWGADGDTPQGTILVTADGGRSWAPQATSPEVLTSISVDASGSGWAFGAAGAALTTRDGGATWQAVRSGTDNALRACWVPGPGAGPGDGVAGWVVGDDGTVLALDAAVR